MRLLAALGCVTQCRRRTVSLAAGGGSEATALHKVRSFIARKQWMAEEHHKALKVALKPQLVASVLLELEEPPEAETLFSFFQWARQQHSFVHEPAPYQAMLHVLRAGGRHDHLDALLGQVMENPHNMTFNLVLRFADAYLEVGQPDKAFAAFTAMSSVHKPGITVCNSLLKALVGSGSDRAFQRAQELLHLLFQWGWLPNDDTFKLLMDAYPASPSPASVYKLFDTIIRMGCVPSFGLNRPLLAFLCQACTAEDALSACERMTNGEVFGDVVLCNSVMSSFCLAGKSAEAHRFLSLARHKGCSPDQASYRIVVLGLARAGNLEPALELFKAMRSLACVDVKTCNIVIDLLCKAGLVDDGFELVHSMMEQGPHPDTVTCNILLDGLVKVNKLDQAAKLLETLSQSYIKPDEFTYNILVQALCAAGRVDDACHQLAAALKQPGVSHDSLYDSLIAGLCRAGKHGHALQVYRKLARPGLVTCNTVIGACVKLGKMEEAWEIYRQMKCRDIFTYNSLIQPLCKAKEVDKALELLDEMTEQQQCRPNTITYGCLVGALCKAQRVSEAEKLLSRADSEPDVIILTALISGYFKLGRVEEACRIFRKMQDRGWASVTPSAITFNVVIDGLCKAHRVAEADLVLQEMKQQDGVAPDEFSFNTLIDGHFKAGDSRGAHRLFHDMAKSGCSRCSITFNTMVDGLCKMGEVGKALNVLEEANRCSATTVFMYNAVIGRLCKLGRVDEATRLFHDMDKKRCRPEVVTFTSLINGLCKKQRVTEAYQMLRLMLDSRVADLNVLPFNMVLNGLCKSGNMDEVGKLVQMMTEQQGISCDLFTYNTLMDGYLKAGRPEQGCRVFYDMLAAGCKPDTVSYNALIGCLCKRGLLEEAFNVVQPGQMQANGCKPDAISYTLLLRHCCAKDDPTSVDFACRLMQDMLAAGWSPNSLTRNMFLECLARDLTRGEQAKQWMNKLGMAC